MRMLYAIVLLGLWLGTADGQTPHRRASLPPPVTSVPATPLPDRMPAEPVAAPTGAADAAPLESIVRELRALVKAVMTLSAQTQVQAANALLDALLKRQATLEGQIENLQTEYDRLRAERAANLARLQDMAAEISRMAYVSQADAEARVRAEVTSRDAMLQTRLTGLETRLNEKRAELVQVTAEIELLKGRLRSLIDKTPEAGQF
jgi:chromosome segregation ATPase